MLNLYPNDATASAPFHTSEVPANFRRARSVFAANEQTHLCAMDESKDAKHDVRQKKSKSAMGGTEDDEKSAMGGTEDAPAPARSLRPRRAPSSTTTEPSPTAVTRRAPLPRPTVNPNPNPNPNGPP